MNDTRLMIAFTDGRPSVRLDVNRVRWTYDGRRLFAYRTLDDGASRQTYCWMSANILEASWVQPNE